MKSFLASMSFARWVIVISLLGSCFLGWVVWSKTRRLGEVQVELTRVKPLIQKIQESALRLNALQKAADKEGLKGEADPELYIRKVAQQDNVNIGQVVITPRTTTPERNIEDRHYGIRPNNRTERFSRLHIGNFLFKLEEDSRRVKVTELKVNPVERVKPGEVPNDTGWTFEATITSRQAAKE
jgi:hypothetical protein